MSQTTPGAPPIVAKLMPTPVAPRCSVSLSSATPRERSDHRRDQRSQAPRRRSFGDWFHCANHAAAAASVVFHARRGATAAILSRAASRCAALRAAAIGSAAFAAAARCRAALSGTATGASGTGTAATFAGDGDALVRAIASAVVGAVVALLGGVDDAVAA